MEVPLMLQSPVPRRRLFAPVIVGGAALWSGVRRRRVAEPRSRRRALVR